MLKKAITWITIITTAAVLGSGLCSCGKQPQTATITLDSNVSTGYAWVAAQTITDNSGESHCFDISDEYVDPEETNGMVGVPGKQVFTLKALEPGNVDVTLKYTRSWEPSNDDDQIVYHFTIDKNLQIECVGSGMVNTDGNGSVLDNYENPPEPVIE